MKLKQIVVILLLIVNCCYFANIVKLPEGGYRPRYPKFKLAKKPYLFQPGDLIDTNAIYLRKLKGKLINSTENINEQSDTIYSFWRFFSNGRAFGNSFNHYPTNIDINDIWSGTIGYYKLENEKIYLELFVPIGGDGGYDMIIGSVRNDTIRFFKRKSNIYGYLSKFGKDTLVLIKTKEPWMKLWAEPDW